jgi:hypothetical protein
MYEMFAGRVPFIGESFMEILTQHMIDPPPPFQRINPKCSLPPALEHVIFRSLAKHPNERHQSTRELADELIEALEESGLRDSMREVLGNERPASIRPPSTRPPSGPFQTQPNPSLPPRGYVRTAAPPDPSRPPPAPSMSSMPSVPAIPTPGPSIAPPPSRAGAWIGGIGAVLLVLGLGLIGYVMFRQQDTTEADAGPPPGGDAGIVVVNNNDRDTGTGGQVPPGADAGIDAGIDAGYDAGILTPDRAVSVGIVSRPSGALVRIEGATACQATPCTVQVEIGRPITLTLTLRHRGRDLIGTRSITPAVSQAPLDIVLRPAPRDAGPGPEDGGTRRRIDAAGLTGLRLIDAAVFQREQP